MGEFQIEPEGYQKFDFQYKMMEFGEYEVLS